VIALSRMYCARTPGGLSNPVAKGTAQASSSAVRSCEKTHDPRWSAHARVGTKTLQVALEAKQVQPLRHGTTRRRLTPGRAASFGPPDADATPTFRRRLRPQ